jgi:hypothetical protein
LAIATFPYAPNRVKCLHCASLVDSGSKFCGDCGVPLEWKGQFGPKQLDPSVSRSAIQASNAMNAKAVQFFQGQGAAGSQKAVSTPSFAKSARQAKPLPPEMVAEMSGLMANLVREQVFLLLHYLVFLVTNLIGLWIATKCYVEFNGDELAKLMMASTPLMFINLIALTALVPIKGTKREIARINERMTYLKLAMDLDSIV